MHVDGPGAALKLLPGAAMDGMGGGVQSAPAGLQLPGAAGSPEGSRTLLSRPTGLHLGGPVDDSARTVHGGARPNVDAKGAETIWGRWKRFHREECEERVEVQYAGVKHGKFGVPTPPNSGSELSSRKVAVAAILESSAGSKRRCPDGQDPIFNMNSTSTEPRV